MEACLLCLERKPDKKNSHIVPKFLTRGLFSLAHHRQTLSVHNNGESKFHRDTPKEDFILCTNCEKRIEVIETELAPIIRKLHAYKKWPNEFQHVVKGQLEYLLCVKISPVLCNLFFYSIIWRLSVSKLDTYGKLKLPDAVEENIRRFLDTNLCDTSSELRLKSAAQLPLPNFYLALIKPKIKTDPPGGMLSAYSYNESDHLITLVDFVLFFFVDEKNIQPPLKPIINNGYSNFIIGIGDNKYWIELNSILYHQVLEAGKVSK